MVELKMQSIVWAAIILCVLAVAWGVGHKMGEAMGEEKMFDVWDEVLWWCGTFINHTDTDELTGCIVAEVAKSRGG